MNSKTAKFLRRCADGRFREIVAEGRQNRIAPYTSEEEAKIQNRVRVQIKAIWNRTPHSQRNNLRNSWEAEYQLY